MAQQVMGRNVRNTEKAFVNVDSMRDWGLSEKAIKAITYGLSANQMAYAILHGVLVSAKEAIPVSGKSPLDVLMAMDYSDIKRLWHERYPNREQGNDGFSRLFWALPEHGMGIKLDFNQSGVSGKRQSILEIDAWNQIPEHCKRFFAPMLASAKGRHGGKTTRNAQENIVRCGTWILSAVPLARVGDCTDSEQSKIERACVESRISTWDVRHDNVGRLANGQAVLLDYGVK